MQTYLIIYRKETGTGGSFTSKNRVFSSKSKGDGKKATFGEGEECQVSLDCINVSKLFRNVLWVPIPPTCWTSLRKMLHKSGYLMIKMRHK